LEIEGVVDRSRAGVYLAQYEDKGFGVSIAFMEVVLEMAIRNKCTRFTRVDLSPSANRAHDVGSGLSVKTVSENMRWEV
jgi:hypothetical protein